MRKTHPMSGWPGMGCFISEKFMSRKAITLMELIMGLAITAVLASTTLISLRFVAGRKLDTEARNTVSDLIWIREMAASRHNNYIVYFAPSTDTYSVYNGSVNAANLVKERKLTVDLANVTDYNLNALTQITFSSPHGYPGNSALISLNQTGRSRVINISDGTGFVRMER